MFLEVYDRHVVIVVFGLVSVVDNDVFDGEIPGDIDGLSKTYDVGTCSVAFQAASAGKDHVLPDVGSGAVKFDTTVISGPTDKRHVGRFVGFKVLSFTCNESRMFSQTSLNCCSNFRYPLT